jgi:penicillin-binding protein 2
VTGWVGPIPGEEAEIWIERGYPVDANVGRSGIESWGEELLSRKRGGDLYLVNEDRTEIITLLSSGEPQASNSIYLTLDKDLQLQAQLAIKDFVGAVVALERNTGRVLAMASSPGFNPNAANPFNFHNEAQWGGFFADLNTPFINRATQGQYPPGSIFKLITMSAALESGLYTPQSELFCAHEWNGLPGVTLYDWTFEKELPASGQLNLLQGLMRSCNPFFYDIGLSLYSNDFPTEVADMARAFGVGSPTGIIGLPEESGQIENPDDAASGETAAAAVQQAIGQHTTTLTPLQAAAYVAAVGNGGTLYQPYVIDRVEDTNGEIIQAFSPEENGTLPISQATLQALRTGMRLVVDDPRGTAFRQLSGFQIPTWGKTGTASAAFGDPHAWFIGYTNAGRPNQPDIAIAVLVENIGDGSEFAAPIWRRVAEGYFYGQPQAIYPWESQLYVFDPSYFEETPEGEEGEGNGDTIQLTPTE